MRLLQAAALAFTLAVTLLHASVSAAAGSSVSEASDAGKQILVLLRLPADHAQVTGAYGGSYGGAATRAARRRIASRLARDHGLRLETDWPMPLAGVDCFVMTVTTGESPIEVSRALERSPHVAWSEPMHVYRTEAAPPPNDPMYRLQPAAKAWRLAELHKISKGRGVRVAVIDSGIDGRHPDLAGQIESRRNFVDSQPDAAERHGTGVAGVISAVDDNRMGIAGVAPGARLMALRACWQTVAAVATTCDTLSLAKALHFAIDNRANVINLSLSGPTDILLGRLIDAARARGMTIVAAIDPELPNGGFPASHSGVIAVASEPWTGSSGISAPGRDVPTTLPSGGWGLSSGSSFAAAHVSGLFALMLEGRTRPAGLVTAGVGGLVDACATLLKTRADCAACACSRVTETAAIARP